MMHTDVRVSWEDTTAGTMHREVRVSREGRMPIATVGGRVTQGAVAGRNPVFGGLFPGCSSINKAQ